MTVCVSTKAAINRKANVVTGFISRLAAHIHVDVSNPDCRLRFASVFIQFGAIGENGSGATRAQQITI